MEPVNRALSKQGFGKRVERLRALASLCRLCPRKCGVDRLRGERGFCRTGMRPWVSSVGPHFGEEPELVGHGGAGTIFFPGCNLRCVFCQNLPISQGGVGREISVEELAGTMLRLQTLGCSNINLVSPTHQVVQIVEALAIARDRGLSLPIVWNCGGYESIEVLRLLDGIVDIYMPDFKYGSSQSAVRYSSAPNYFDVAKEALLEMHRQVGDLVVEGGIAYRGLLVRHLVLPDGLAGTENVLRFIASEISSNTYVNVMAQYYPSHRAWDYPELSRRITDREYEEALAISKRVGLKRSNCN